MNILFISHHKYPHVGGVEKHVSEVSKCLAEKGHNTQVISEEDIKFPHVKIIGLLYIWLYFFKNIGLFLKFDAVFVHDVFIWIFPFRFLFPFKKIITVMHGWEGIYPIPYRNILLKRLSAFFSDSVIAVGRYIEKYYGIKADGVIYGGHSGKRNFQKKKSQIVFVGRLEEDTGLPEFLKWLESNRELPVYFAGGGSMRSECKIYGKILGFVNPSRLLSQSKFCVPGGYLSFIDAWQNGCEIMTFAGNPLKKDYWEEIGKIKEFPLWNEVADYYLTLAKK